MAHIEWLLNIREAAQTVIDEYHLSWPSYRLNNAIAYLKIALSNYDDFTANNEQSNLSLPDLPDLRGPSED